MTFFLKIQSKCPNFFITFYLQIQNSKCPAKLLMIFFYRFKIQNARPHQEDQRTRPGPVSMGERSIKPSQHRMFTSSFSSFGQNHIKCKRIPSVHLQRIAKEIIHNSHIFFIRKLSFDCCQCHTKIL